MRAAAGVEVRELELVMIDGRPVAVFRPVSPEGADDKLYLLLPPGSVRRVGGKYICDEEIDDPLSGGG